MTESLSPASPLTESHTAEVERLLAAMTLAEKAGQVTQVEYGSIAPDEVATWAIGSVLSGGGGNHGDGRAADWRAGVAAYVDGSRRSRLGIPILYGTDAVHGHSNVRGATIFPHNIGLGATRDPELVRAIGRAAALETAATGARWAFAPCLAVPQDVRWGRTYEGFSEDTTVVSDLGRAMVEGWHGDDLAAHGVLACPKHFAGEGAMVWGTAGRARHPWIEWWDGWGPGWQIDQGDVRLDEASFRQQHLTPFAAAVEAGAMTVMACYATWHGVPLHAHHHMLTEVLKGEIGFAGFVVSDWMAIDQLDADYATAVAMSINAGVDMVMVPFDYQRFIAVVIDLVESGRIPMTRLDDAVRRILTAKAAAGLLDGSQNEVPIGVVGCDDHRALARRAAAASAVVISDSGALPIRPDERVLTAGLAIDDIGLSCGGWTITWDGGIGATTDGRTVLDGLRAHVPAGVVHAPDGDHGERRAEVGVVTVHEPPYVEGGGDRADLRLPDEQVDVVQRLRTHVDRLIVVVVSGRPLLLDAVFDVADAVVAAWLPGSEADGIADALCGVSAFSGTLPVRWPRHQGVVGPEASDDELDVWPVGHGCGVPAHARTQEAE